MKANKIGKKLMKIGKDASKISEINKIENVNRRGRGREKQETKDYQNTCKGQGGNARQRMSEVGLT